MRRIRNNIILALLIINAIAGAALLNWLCQESKQPEAQEQAAIIIGEEVAQEEPPAGFYLEPEEREIVCRVVAAEARGEGLQGMMAVSQVIRDRAILWDMTPTEVVTAPDQFAAPYQGELTDDIYLAVANVFDGGMNVFEEPATHFYSGPEPYWASSKESRGSIGNHRFMY